MLHIFFQISTAEPGLFSYLNYHKADLWGSGALAYEIFGCENPFYAQTKEGRLDSRTYNHNQLPPLPEDIPQAIKRLVSDILQRDPAKVCARVNIVKYFSIIEIIL